MVDKKAINLKLLQTVTTVVAIFGAIGSLYFMFKAGRNQKSILLIAFFTAWVLSPFAGLFLATKTSYGRIIPDRTTLYWLMIILAIGSLVAYSGVLTPSGTKGAFIFLVAPFASWVVIVIIFLISKKRPTETTARIKK